MMVIVEVVVEFTYRYTVKVIESGNPRDNAVTQAWDMHTERLEIGSIGVDDCKVTKIPE